MLELLLQGINHSCCRSIKNKQVLFLRAHALWTTCFQHSEIPRIQGLFASSSGQIHKAFQKPQVKNEILQAENTVLQDQATHDQAMSKKARPQTKVGDRMILTRNHMISCQEAEHELIAKGPRVAKHQEQVSQQLNRSTAANENNNDEDSDSMLLSLSPLSSPPLTCFLDNIEACQPLSTIENIDPPCLNMYDAVPQATSSCCQL